VVGSNRHTLYTFCLSGSTKCPGSHDPDFPPLIADGRVMAAQQSQLTPSKLGTIRLESGQRQVTYYGHPLYYYRGDHASGQTRGEYKRQNRGEWQVVDALSGRRALPASY
jgi:predicted lipoprotein with Yx(FWY)xxD motif